MRWLKQQEQAAVQEGVLEMEAIKVEKCMTFSDAFRSGQKSGAKSRQGAAGSMQLDELIQIKKFEITTSAQTTPKESPRLAAGTSSRRPSNRDLEGVPEP